MVLNSMFLTVVVLSVGLMGAFGIVILNLKAIIQNTRLKRARKDPNRVLIVMITLDGKWQEYLVKLVGKHFYVDNIRYDVDPDTLIQDKGAPRAVYVYGNPMPWNFKKGFTGIDPVKILRMINEAKLIGQSLTERKEAMLNILAIISAGAAGLALFACLHIARVVQAIADHLGLVV